MSQYKVSSNEDWALMLKAADKIHDQELRTFIKGYLNDEVPDYFAHIAASASGKYHPKFALGDGGLIRHSVAAALIGRDISKLEYLQASAYDRDVIYAALLIHDTFKQGEGQGSGTTINSHPAIAAKHILEYAKKVGFDPEVANILARLVYTHMGQWYHHKPGNRIQYLVHQADYIASRRYLDINVKEWLNDGTD